MKKLLVLGLLLSNLAYAEDTKVPVGLEPRIVELHITQKEVEPAQSESKKKKRVVLEELPHGAICSGSFIDAYGDIITAGHCAREAADIDVITSDNQTYRATITAVSATHDLALLHIDKLNTPHFNPAQHLERGEKIFILGSPLGITNALSTGVIAKFDGDHTLIDCSALPGNSGSAVFDAEGNLVGVLTAGYVVGMGVTHLNVMQSLESVYFFVLQAFKGK